MWALVIYRRMYSNLLMIHVRHIFVHCVAEDVGRDGGSSPHGRKTTSSVPLKVMALTAGM